MNTNSKVFQGAIVGCGFFGGIQLEAWGRMSEEAKIVAACDPDLDRARRSAPRGYAALEELLDNEPELDFVDIATRPETHLELVRQVLQRGLPVICQKPMAPTWDEAAAMAETADSTGVPLMIHENWRWQPWYRIVKGRLLQGTIGAPVAYRFRIRKRDGLGPDAYPAQPYFRQMPRLLIYETLVHPIDTARFLFGDIESIFARIRRVNRLIAGEDQALLTVSHRAGPLGSIDGHRFLEKDTPPLGDAVFEGEEGVLSVDMQGSVHENGSLVWSNDCFEGYRGDSVLATQRHFIDCLRSGTPFETSARDYLETVRAVEAAYRSAREGAAVELP